MYLQVRQVLVLYVLYVDNIHKSFTLSKKILNPVILINWIVCTNKCSAEDGASNLLNQVGAAEKAGILLYSLTEMRSSSKKN